VWQEDVVFSSLGQKRARKAGSSMHIIAFAVKDDNGGGVALATIVVHCAMGRFINSGAAAVLHLCLPRTLAVECV
jgi:hypothetical protein